MNTDLPPLYTIAYDGKDIPGIVHAISKCVFEEGFTIVDVNIASGANIYKIFITCHRRTDVSSDTVEQLEFKRGIADEAWLQTSIQQMLEDHYKNYYHRILDEKVPNTLGQVSVYRHTKTDARWTISIDLQFGGTVGTLAAITGILSFYINVNDMIVRSIAVKQDGQDGKGKFIFIFYIQASLLSRRVYDPHNRDKDYLRKREEAAEQNLPSIVREPLGNVLTKLRQQITHASLNAGNKATAEKKLSKAQRQSKKTLWNALMGNDKLRRTHLLRAQHFAETGYNEARSIEKEQYHAQRIAYVLYDLLAWAYFAFPEEFHVRRLDVGCKSPHSQYGAGVTWDPSSGNGPILYSVERPTSQ